MQSQRKNSGSYFSKQQSTLLQASKTNFLCKKKLSVATQTENFPNLDRQARLCNFSTMSMEEIKDNYNNTLKFLNNCHGFINKVFKESLITSNDEKSEKMFDFGVPQVPNYFSVLELFLEKKKLLVDHPHSKRNNVPKNLEVKEAGLKENGFLLKNIGDGPGPVKNPQDIAPSYGREDVSSQSKTKNCDNGTIDNYGTDFSFEMKNFGVKKRPSISPSRLVKSEKDILKKPSRHELKAFSTTFEEILMTCDAFEKKSKEHILKKEVPLEIYQNYREKKVENTDREKVKSKENLHENNIEDFQYLKQKNDTQEDDIMENGRQNFNLLEYALNNLRESDFDSDSSPPSPNNKITKNIDKICIMPSKGLLNENLQEILLDFQDILPTRKSSTVLNEVPQSQSPKKVNEMFKKISKENLISSGKRNSSSCEDNEIFIKFIENGHFSDDLTRVDQSSKSFINYGSQRVSAQNYDNVGMKTTSSSDSIILTDEEFERRQNNFVDWSKEKGHDNTEQTRTAKNSRDIYLVQESLKKPLKAHPLKLTDKDRTHADQKILQTIGLFTEKGDIRPGIISILEEKQRMKFTHQPAKNVQFRTRRKFDVKMHYNISTRTEEPDKPVSDTLEYSKESSEQHLLGSNSSLHSSGVTFSSSTVLRRTRFRKLSSTTFSLFREFNGQAYIARPVPGSETVSEAHKNDVEPVFSLVQQKKNKHPFSYEDTTIESSQRRFEAISQLNDLFGFLCNFQNLDSEVIRLSCIDLDIALQIQKEDKIYKDIDEIDLQNEIVSYKTLNPKSKTDADSPINILNYIRKNNLMSLFPNLFISLRIFLCLPVSVASGERSFSKLIIIKNFLRTSMSQERLSDFAIISHENQICEAIDHKEMINEFASLKAICILL